MTPRIVILSAPSGGGKTVVTKELISRHPELFGYSVSATTRPPRPGEVDGQAYRFLTRKDFEGKRDAGEFLETAEYAGELYGTLRSEVESVLRRGLNVVLDIEVNGAQQVRRQYPDAITVFLQPPSAVVLLERLRGRQTESAQAMARRVEIAQQELAASTAYQHMVVNEDLDLTVNRVLAIVKNPDRVEHHTGEMLHHIQELMAGLQLEAHKLHDELKESR